MEQERTEKTEETEGSIQRDRGQGPEERMHRHPLTSSPVLATTCNEGLAVATCRSPQDNAVSVQCLCLLLFFLAFLPVSRAADPVAGASQVLDLPAAPRPVEVQVSFHLLDVHKVDDEAETFEFSGVLTLQWKDSRQAFDAAAEGVTEKLFHGSFQFNEISPAWYPQVVLANASGAPDNQGVLLRLQPDGTGRLIQTIHAVARSKMNLRRYPFDQQRLEAVFEVLGFGAEEVTLVPVTDATTADLSRIAVPQWDLQSVAAATREVIAPYAGDGGTSSAFVLTLEAKRQSFFMVRLVILPLFVIVVLSWSVFWMDRSSLGDRMSVSFVGILTAVAYQIMVSDIMPDIAYVTFMNAFLSFSFLVMCATVLANLRVGVCDRRGDVQRGDRIDLRCRRAFPLVYAALIVADALFMFFGIAD